MAWRFRKSKSLGPLRLTLGKRGISASAGVKGARVGVNTTRGAYRSVGIPGTGLYSIDYASSGRSRGRDAASQAAVSEQRPKVPSFKSPWNALAVVAIILLVITPFLGAFAVVVVGVMLWRDLTSPPNMARRRLAEAERMFSAREVDVTGALDKVGEALELDPDAPTESARHDALNIAEMLEARGDLPQAIAVLEHAQRVMPHHLGLRGVLGGLLFNAGEHQAAIPHLEAASSFSPVALALPLGVSLSSVGRSDEAIVVFQQALQADPGNVRLLLGLAQVFSRSGNRALAIETLQRAPLRKRNLDEELKAVHYSLGRLYQAEGNEKKAVQHFNRVYGQDVGYSDVADRLADLNA